MIGINNPLCKYLILEEGDVIERHDEWYCPISDIWKPIIHDIEETVGYEWYSKEYKPMRRKNPEYNPQAKDWLPPF